MPHAPGTIVRLKSGGPSMTVVAYDRMLEKYVCQWFDRNNSLEAGHFYETTIDVLRPLNQPNLVPVAPNDPRNWKDY